MKKSLFSLLVTTLALLTIFGNGMAAFAQETDLQEEPALSPCARPAELPCSLRVCGSGTVYAPADGAVLCFYAESHAKNIPAARQANDDVLQHLTDACSGAGRLCVQSFSSYEDEESGSASFTRWISLVTDQIGELAQLLQKLTDAGASGITDVTYTISNRAPYEKEALQLAVADATDKAAALGSGIFKPSTSAAGTHRDRGGGAVVGRQTDSSPKNSPLVGNASVAANTFPVGNTFPIENTPIGEEGGLPGESRVFGDNTAPLCPWRIMGIRECAWGDGSGAPLSPYRNQTAEIPVVCHIKAIFVAQN